MLKWPTCACWFQHVVSPNTHILKELCSSAQDKQRDPKWRDSKKCVTNTSSLTSKCCQTDLVSRSMPSPTGRRRDRWVRYQDGISAPVCKPCLHVITESKVHIFPFHRLQKRRIKCALRKSNVRQSPRSCTWERHYLRHLWGRSWVRTSKKAKAGGGHILPSHFKLSSIKCAY